MSEVGAKILPATALISCGVRAFFAPVERSGGTTVPFDPAAMGRFLLDTTPAGWLDGGRVLDFSPSSETAISAQRSGSPAMALRQTRTQMGAEVQWKSLQWSKLQMALNSGSQQMNLLQVASEATAAASGGAAEDAMAVMSGSTATELQLTVPHGLQVGDVIAVDVDYDGSVGYVGSYASGAYVASSDAVAGDVHFVRRVTFNLGVVADVDGGAVTLAEALPAGVPTESMKVARVKGFVDREGGTFFQEWSALFVVDGVQGERVLYHYPRLQTVAGAVERESLVAPLERWRLKIQMRALAVKDPNDGEEVFCFRSYLPAAMREVLQ